MSTDDNPGALLRLPPAMRSISGKSEASHELLPHSPLHKADRSSANMAEAAGESDRELRTVQNTADGNDAFEDVKVVGQQQCDRDTDYNNALFKCKRLFNVRSVTSVTAHR